MNRKLYFTLIMVVSLFANIANGAPMALSINSDGQKNTTWDSLYLIDLASGSDERKGQLFSGAFDHFDTEGLAFDSNGTLWGIDDGFGTLFPTLFPIDVYDNPGSINFTEVISLPTFPTGGGNDFGMTFACDNTLYVTSVNTHNLYSIELEDGSVQNIGDLGANVNISAIAAIGNPTRLYGLGNGQFENGSPDSPNLYRIDTTTGLATVIGALGMGDTVDPYNEAGLAFASDGTLWAITDRSALNNQASQILQIDVDTGAATPVSYTSETGFESLTLGPPAECVTQVAEDEYEQIPALGPAGLLLAMFVLMSTGLIFLRRRIF